MPKSPRPAASAGGADQGLDEREAGYVRKQYLALDHLSDFAQIKAAFERMLSGDASVAPELMALLTHSNEEVASIAAQEPGRFPSETASAALKQRYATDTRLLVRAMALGGLGRMKDPETASLALAALSGDDESMRGAAVGALQLLGDRQHSAALLAYYDRHPEDVSGESLRSLAELGDPPGSTAVRDRLLTEANDKANKWVIRHDAAIGLETMGHADLVRPVLDIGKCYITNHSLIVVKGEMEYLAGERGVTVKGQAEVDALLRDIDVGERYRSDEWGRPLRAEFVSVGVFEVISDGPDMTRGTGDDLPTGEDLDAYLDRVFPDQLEPL